MGASTQYLQANYTTASHTVASFAPSFSLIHELLTQPDLGSMAQLLSEHFHASIIIEQPRSTVVAEFDAPHTSTSSSTAGWQEVRVLDHQLEVGVLKIAGRVDAHDADLLAAAMLHPMLRGNDRQTDKYRQFGRDLELVLDGLLSGSELRASLRQHRLDPDLPISVIAATVEPGTDLFFGDRCTIEHDHPFAVGFARGKYVLLLQGTEQVRHHAEHLCVHIEHSQLRRAAVGIGRATEGTIDLRTALLEGFEASERGFGVNERVPLTLDQILRSLPTGTLLEHTQELLRPLFEHDSSRQSDLLHTLRVLVRHDFSIVRSAKELYMHQNTVKYRVTQIGELTGLHLNRLDGRAQAWIAVTLLDQLPARTAA